MCSKAHFSDFPADAYERYTYATVTPDKIRKQRPQKLVIQSYLVALFQSSVTRV